MGHISFYSMLMTLLYWLETNTSNKKTEALLDESNQADLDLNEGMNNWVGLYWLHMFMLCCQITE
jgi:hypothetical protein